MTKRKPTISIPLDSSVLVSLKDEPVTIELRITLYPQGHRGKRKVRFHLERPKVERVKRGRNAAG